MKNYNLIRLAFSFLMIALCVFYLTSCEKEILQENQVTDVSKLVDRALKEHPSEDEILSITEEYQNLTPQGMRLFFDSATEKILDDVSDEYSENLQEELELMKEIRSHIFEKSVQEFDKPFNRLNQQEVSLLLENNNYSTTKSASCSSKNYPYKACRTTQYDTSCSGYSRYATPDRPNDCDFEYRFSGYQTRAYGTNWFAVQLINYWGNCGILRRYSGGHSRLLFGQWGVYFWIGPGWAAQPFLKMR